MTLASPLHSSPDQIQHLHTQTLSMLEGLLQKGQNSGAIAEAIAKTLNSINGELSAAEENIDVLRMLAVLNNVSADALNATDDKQRRTLRSSVAEVIRDILHADVVVLYEAPESEDLRTRALPGLAGKIFYPELMDNRLRTNAQVLIFWKQKDEAPTYIPDAQAEPALIAPPKDSTSPATRFTIREKIASTVVLPILFNSNSVGLAFINYRTPQIFDEQFKRQVQRLAQQLGLAMHSIRANRRATEYRKKQDKLLSYISEITQSMAEREKVQSLIVKAAVELVEAPRGSFVLWDKNSPHGQIVTGYTAKEEVTVTTNIIINKDTPFQHAILSGNVGRIDDVAESEDLSNEEKTMLQSEGIRSLMVVPVIDDTNEVIASIGVDETRFTRHFDDHEMSLCQFLANHVAIVFKHIDTLTETRDVLAIQQKALDAAEQKSAAGKKADPDDAFKIIVDEGLRLINADYGQLMRIDSKGEYLQVEYSTELKERGHRVPFANSVTGLAARMKKAILIGDIDGDIANDRDYGKYYQRIMGRASKSELAVPLLDPDTENVLGVLNAESNRAYAFTEKHKRVWEQLAKSVVKVVRLSETIAEKNALLSLNEIARKVVNPDGADFDELLQVIFTNALSLADATVGQMIWLNENGKLVNRLSTENDVGKELDINNSVSGIAVLERSTINVGNLEKDSHPKYGKYKERHQWFNAKVMKSELAVPIQFIHELVGVINLESEREYGFTELHQTLVEALAGQAAMLIKQVQLLEEAQSLNQERLATELANASARNIDNVLHRLNNPLGAARQYVLLASDGLSETPIDVNQIQSDIQKAVEQLERVANNIRERVLDSRTTTAKALDVHSQVQKAVTAWRRKWQDKLNDVQFDDSGLIAALAPVSCGEKLHELFLDLLDNAFEARDPARSMSIKVRGREVAQWVEVEVEDNGQGIPLYLWTRIFERKFSTKFNDKDIVRGLGLSWDRHYAATYGGDVDILRSEPNVGTIMIVRLKKWDNTSTNEVE